ncbi:MAG: hypothetical protein M3R45_07545 [Pseudomonadota bacterium]|nr:hypothetical protein [Pseudomonadota bacterium]
MTCPRYCPLPMPLRVRRLECWLGLAAGLMVWLALAGPVVVQPDHYHDFADQRVWCAVPHAMDVLSNFPFAAWGAGGLWALARALRLRALDSIPAGLAALFLAGLIVTAGVSGYYHWRPDDAGLVWDRASMVLAFAGLLGLAAAQAVSRRAGVALAAAVLVLGLAAVRVWAVSGNLLPWAVLQAAGMVLILVAACQRPLQPAPGLRIRWALVLAFYALAKGLELADHQVFELTGQLVSGHSLKHVVASLAAWPVVLAVKAAVAAAERCRESSAKSRSPFTTGAGEPGDPSQGQTPAPQPLEPRSPA